MGIPIRRFSFWRSWDTCARERGMDLGGPQTRGIVFHREAVFGRRQADLLDSINRIGSGDARHQLVVERVLQLELDLDFGHLCPA